MCVRDACFWSARWLLAFGGVALGIVKFLGGVPGGLAYPPHLYFIIAAAELAAGVFMLTDHYRVAVAGWWALAGIGFAIAVIAPGMQCGCVGALVKLGQRDHMILSASVAILASVAVLSARESVAPSPQVTNPAGR